jgi:hypothetical protein
MTEDNVPADPLWYLRDLPPEQRFPVWAHPIAIVEDRYGGTYSGGEWIAIAQARDLLTGGAVLRLLNSEPDEEPSPWGGDDDAMNFWDDPPKWVAVGDTPAAALKALELKNLDVTCLEDKR